MYQGSDAQFRYGLELAEGIPGGTQVDMRFVSEDMNMERPDTQNPNIDASGEETEGDNLHVEGQGSYSSAIDVVSILREIVHHHGWAAHTSPDAGVDQWVARKAEPTDTPLTEYVDSLSYDIHRGDDNPQRIIGGKISERKLNINEGEHVTMDRTVFLTRDTHLEDPDLTTGLAATFDGVVIVTGHRGDPASTDALKVKVTTAGAFGVAKVKFTKGAVAYGATSYFIRNGERIPVILADGTQAGISQRDPVYVTFWSADDTDTFTLNDEWTIDPVRGIATPTYSTATVLTGVDAQGSVTLGGTTNTYALHNVGVSVVRPRKQNGGIGSKYNYSVIDNGKRSYMVTLQRDYTDLDYYRALLNGALTSVDILMTGARIGATAYYETYHIELLTGKVKKAGTNVSTPNALPESIDIRAHRVGSGPTFRETLIVPGVASL